MSDPDRGKTFITEVESALELLETHAKALEEENARLRADFARVVIANREVAEVNTEQAETIERLRQFEPLKGGTPVAEWVLQQEVERLRAALLEAIGYVELESEPPDNVRDWRIAAGLPADETTSVIPEKDNG